MTPSPRRIADLLFAARVPHGVNRVWARRLSVLVYHRVADASAPGFDTFRPTVSASPDAFAAQLDFVCRHCAPVSLQDVVDAAHGQLTLPPRAVLVTFDDGYRDNVEVALPLLRARRVPAVVFLTTGRIARTSAPFFWDRVACVMHHTRLRSGTLPLIGQTHWPTPAHRDALVKQLVERLKWLPDDDRDQALASLECAVGVEMPPDAFDDLYMTWDDARRAAAAGMAIGSHTVTHAILPTVDLERARHELAASRADIARELGAPAQAFAFPNGDADPIHETLARDAGYAIAFAGSGGPIGMRRLRARPFAVRRVPVSGRDTLATFAAKLAGFDAVRQRLARRSPRAAAASPGA